MLLATERLESSRQVPTQEPGGLRLDQRLLAARRRSSGGPRPRLVAGPEALVAVGRVGGRQARSQGRQRRHDPPGRAVERVAVVRPPGHEKDPALRWPRSRPGGPCWSAIRPGRAPIRAAATRPRPDCEGWRRSGSPGGAPRRRGCGPPERPSARTGQPSLRAISPTAAAWAAGSGPSGGPATMIPWTAWGKDGTSASDGDRGRRD